MTDRRRQRLNMVSPELHPDDVNKVAKALYGEALRQAREEISKVEFDLSDSINVFKQLRKETDTGIATIFSAYLDECLKMLFDHQITSNKQTNDIFSFNGPLGTFSSRIDIALAFRFISKTSYDRLTNFRKIRNDFAHNPFGINFGTQSVRDRINNININHKKFLDEIRKRKTVMKLTKSASRLSPKQLYLVKAALTLAYVTSEMIVFPTAERFRVNAPDILADYDSAPDNLKNIRRHAAICVFQIFKT